MFTPKSQDRQTDQIEDVIEEYRPTDSDLEVLAIQKLQKASPDFRYQHSENDSDEDKSNESKTSPDKIKDLTDYKLTEKDL